jgi:hypothetical protein
MSNKRDLTPEEVAMAARLKAAIAAIPGMTEESLGAELGVSQGAVSHWTGARLPVPAKRAPKLALLLGFDDPGEISTAYRAVVAMAAEPSAPSHSHHARLDPEIVSSAQQALAEMYKANGRTYHGDDVARFVLLYEKYASRKAGVPEAELFGAGLSDFRTKGAASERVDGVPDAGTSKRAVARRVRRQA